MSEDKTFEAWWMSRPLDIRKIGATMVAIEEAWNAARRAERDEIERLQAENARMFDALTWAMGANGGFRLQGTMEGPHYWRGELAERAGIFWNGERFLHRPTNPAFSEPPGERGADSSAFRLNE